MAKLEGRGVVARRLVRDPYKVMWTIECEGGEVWETLSWSLSSVGRRGVDK